ncbi:branched-chain amino acid ABC transporter permease [Verminephrobacter aporrectodeae]|uniref:Branched-chain amino acid ABC transporter permease n=1 Tax=Verminephrobacter aporrectodeae subsp. tuberculatae TaxID=1110392 RepID=A0ABT3KPT5_9BURK|nr:branched-chain amino acid ABC transporter permease [Verminephrobacter aporrectodeae]MCW5221340.1 branched-chain amino acid ABC transporter permease [Verminephrobacter aporrectodeae subsp. tuberculatae]MCW5257651.1 branched-chain amino acid ABC transporter permease [Verminephrobacter aporrectodeae subsp. tuberculatae]MCW5290631.1 branched-chain amino acid ABC transporter permease [Verminephrobacter aporrectodeae subsp. tuberculatae]MCW5319939.1 branched-chain amino acid ABC transporter permea
MPFRNLAAIGYGLLLMGLLAAPFLGAYPIFVMKLMCFALFASAFNLLLGYTGLLSFGHAAFLGGGAYLSGHALKVWGLTPELGLLLGMAGGALLGLLFGWLAIRRQGIYFSMITLALAQMLFFACLQAPFTGGEDGLQGVARGRLFGLIDLQNDLRMYYLTLAIVVLAFLLIVRTIHSPFGQVLKGIKENEPRAISLGYDTQHFKLLAFVLSAALAGLAGALKTLVLGFATLSDVHWTASGQVILMTLVGGLGTLSGPLVGSAVVVLLENKIGEFGQLLATLTGVPWFGTLGESVTMVTGLIFVVCVLAFRRGVMGEIIAWTLRRRARGPRSA